uniref:Putative secreted protein n=1 Tax=Ixodes ricinus TaxID=34613 RepID=A0A6B0U0H7_IXORI
MELQKWHWMYVMAWPLICRPLRAHSPHITSWNATMTCRGCAMSTWRVSLSGRSSTRVAPWCSTAWHRNTE